MTVSREVLRVTRDALRKEQAWREAARTLTLGEPDEEIARRHLLEFVRWGQPAYEVGHFHRELCAHLEWFSGEVTAKRSPRMMIAAPPQHGKSEIVSRRFPVWHLGHNPHHHAVVASYNQDFANRISRASRGVRTWARKWWPLLAPHPEGSDGVEHWEIEGGGSYKAVGAGAGLTGSPAHILVIDDILKDRVEADSLVTRESRWTWYTETAYTRLAPGGGILVMATRWHEDDPSGRILREFAEREGWRIVVFPAIAERDESWRKAGDALHPARYNIDHLERARYVLGGRGFAALYQQRPSPAGGSMFLRDWLGKRFTWDPLRPPERYTEIAISCDATFKGTDGTDYVSLGAWARKGWTAYYRLDQVRARMSYVETRQALRDLAQKWRPSAVLIETKANGEALLDDLKGQVPGLIARSPDPHGNKVSRATVATPRFEAGEVYLPEDASWVSDYVEELASFPSGAHDDMVDDTSQYFQWILERRLSGEGGQALTKALAARLGHR